MSLDNLKQDFNETKEQVVQSVNKIEELKNESPEALMNQISQLAWELSSWLSRMENIKASIEEAMNWMGMDNVPEEFKDFHNWISQFIWELWWYLSALDVSWWNSNQWWPDNYADNRWDMHNEWPRNWWYNEWPSRPSSPMNTWWYANGLQQAGDNTKQVSSDFSLQWKSADLQFASSKVDAESWKVKSFATWVRWSLDEWNINYWANYSINNSEWFKDEKLNLVDKAEKWISYLMKKSEKYIQKLNWEWMFILANDISEISEEELNDIKDSNADAYKNLKDMYDKYYENRKHLN